MAFDQDSWNDGLIIGAMCGITAYSSAGGTINIFSEAVITSIALSDAN